MSYLKVFVFLLASNDNPTIKVVGKYLEDAKEIRSYFWDYYDREEKLWGSKEN